VASELEYDPFDAYWVKRGWGRAGTVKTASRIDPHSLAVRATDGTGAAQTSARATPFPAGATGWHTITVTVS
jgi:hypothetical protein